jgi:hypothetical protein
MVDFISFLPFFLLLTSLIRRPQPFGSALVLVPSKETVQTLDRIRQEFVDITSCGDATAADARDAAS